MNVVSHLADEIFSFFEIINHEKWEFLREIQFPKGCIKIVYTIIKNVFLWV